MRRVRLVLLAAVVLLGVFLIDGSSIAAQESDLAEHPLVGSWILDTDTENPENPPSLAIFSSDGTYLEVDVDGTGAGVWDATGDQTADLTFSFHDEAGGMGIVRASLEVTDDELTATYTLEFVDADGTSSGEIGPGTAAGTRMEVEPMGTPVGTFEEVFAEPVATPES